jgi:hypothetical protein
VGDEFFVRRGAAASTNLQIDGVLYKRRASNSDKTGFHECEGEAFGVLRWDLRTKTVGDDQSLDANVILHHLARARALSILDFHIIERAACEDNAGAHAPVPFAVASKQRHAFDVGFDVDARQILEFALSAFLGVGGQRLAEALSEVRAITSLTSA